MAYNKPGECRNTGRTHFQKGFVPWNKGKRGCINHDHSLKLKEYYKINKPYWKGKKRSEETKIKIGEFFKGRKLTDEHKQKLRGRKLTREHIRKVLRRRAMSSLEIKFDEICKKNNLPYTFVGNGKFFIERKNPDFINTNGEKVAVEVYCRRHKEIIPKINVEEWKKERTMTFEKYGWKIIYFDETQLKEDIVVQCLGRGD